MARRKPQLSTQIREEAASWFIDFNDGVVRAAGREEFNAWLRRSPEHVRAYLEISASFEDAAFLRRRGPLDIDALVARAAAEHNVYALETARSGEDVKAPASRSLAGKRLLAMAASVLLAVAGAVVWYRLTLTTSTYVTQIGEQRSIALEDGSSVHLNSRSRLAVKFTEHERTVELIEGQALFSVAKNPARPFVVHSGATSVRAVGTEFDVYRKSAGTIVTVIEGRVAVPLNRPHGAAGQAQGGEAVHEVFLTAGEQLEVTPERAAVPRRANLTVATAWTEQKLIFEETPLSDVVEEFNRYNRRQLVIRDPELQQLHVSGVFPSTDSGRMVAFLRQRFGVTLEQSADRIEISRRNNVDPQSSTPDR